MANSADLDSLAIELEDVQQAAERIRQYAHVTPVLTCDTLDRLAGRQLYLKCENLQKTGAFKFRGACNAVQSLSEEEASRGVITHSSGNHAGALASAAAARCIKAYIVVPEGTPQCKLDAIAGYGAQLEICAPGIEAREAACRRLQQATGAVFIPPYNYAPVMAGQGTVALELLKQVQGLDAIIVCVSGGGLISGIATAAKGLNPDITILAAEPSGRNDAADVAAALQAGHLVEIDPPDTIADGLKARMGTLTWPVIRQRVDGAIVVSEEDIVNAMQLCYERAKVVVEPSGAAALAAALNPSFQQDPRWQHLRRVGIILSGGNADLAGKGLWASFLRR
ncbi:hypothetical protein WJX73_010929 [Symbiochloris irregularis]|uniref:Serine racemase n=1 Tax=Symbiochloris irregularis TaxID=706552 RepID=A0AAW1NWP2_9CHLO